MNTLSNNSPESMIIILCTLPNNKDLALQLIQTLLNNKLAGCITLFNAAHSFYYWNNQLENQIEFQLLIKTKRSLEKKIFNTIKKIHPYKIPELLVIPIISSEINYLKWINSKLI